MPGNNLRHGDTGTKFHKVWIDMNGRCYTKSKTSYKNYGLKGIKVSIFWHSYENFKKDMYQPYLEHVKEFGEKQTTIDRVNVKGNYTKENCRWATYKVQSNNRTHTHYVTINGKTQSLTMWSREKGIAEKLVDNRVYKLGWDPERALNTIKRKFTKKIWKKK